MTRRGIFTVLLAALLGFGSGLLVARKVDRPDPRGRPVICNQVTPGVLYARACTDAEVRRLKKAIQEAVVQVPLELTMTQQAWLGSFMLDTDVGAFRRSILLRLLAKGDMQSACDELPKWDKLRGIPDPHKAARRQLERKLCLIKV